MGRRPSQAASSLAMLRLGLILRCRYRAGVPLLRLGGMCRRRVNTRFGTVSVSWSGVSDTGRMGGL